MTEGPEDRWPSSGTPVISFPTEIGGPRWISGSVRGAEGIHGLPPFFDADLPVPDPDHPAMTPPRTPTLALVLFLLSGVVSACSPPAEAPSAPTESASAEGSAALSGGGSTDWTALSPDLQIRLAVQAASEEQRADATVQGFDSDGTRVVLREGTNGLICMAPDPAAPRFEVSCHHEGLEPFFARGRELAAQGLTGADRIQARLAEVDAGTLPLPYGGVNSILTGSGFDPESGDILNPYVRWVIYTPGATPASTGIPDQPVAGGPWLMDAGSPGSHIMISPPRPGDG